jgi:hypothetical protein
MTKTVPYFLWQQPVTRKYFRLSSNIISNNVRIRHTVILFLSFYLKKHIKMFKNFAAALKIFAVNNYNIIRKIA